MPSFHTWTFIASASLTVLGTCLHIFWVQERARKNQFRSRKSPPALRFGSSEQERTRIHSAQEATTMASVGTPQRPTATSATQMTPCVVDLTHFPYDAACVLWEEIMTQMPSYEGTDADTGNRNPMVCVQMPVPDDGDDDTSEGARRVPRTPSQRVADYVLEIRPIAVADEREGDFHPVPSAVNDHAVAVAQASRMRLCVHVGVEEVDNLVIRELVKTRIMPRLMRLVPCADSDMCSAIVRVVRGFLTRTQQDDDPLFVDVLPLLSNPRAYAWLIQQGTHFVNAVNASCGSGHDTPTNPRVTAIVALETRGFMFGVGLATALNLSFIPLRRPGTYPGRLVIRQSYTKASGADAMELDGSILGEGECVVLVDDLLASGASLLAASRVIKAAEGHVRGAFVPLEIANARGRMNLWKYQAHWPVHSIVQLHNLREAARIDDIRDSKTIVESKAPCL